MDVVGAYAELTFLSYIELPHPAHTESLGNFKIFTKDPTCDILTHLFEALNHDELIKLLLVLDGLDVTEL